MSQPIVKFRFQPGTLFNSVALIAVSILVFGFISVAVTNTSQATVFGDQLSVQNTSIMIWLGSLLVGLFLIPFPIAMIIQSRKPARHVTLTEKHITSPKSSIHKAEVTLAFADISKVNVFSWRLTKMLELKSTKSNLIILNISVRPNSEFQRLVDLTKERVAAATD